MIDGKYRKHCACVFVQEHEFSSTHEWVEVCGYHAAQERELKALKERLAAAPEGEARKAVIEECAKAVEDYNWVDNDSVQGPDDHQRAVAAAVRRLSRLRMNGGRTS